MTRLTHPSHSTVCPWFDTVLTGDDDFTVPVGVWASFLRMATHRRVFIAVEHAWEVVTLDRDFAGFSSVPHRLLVAA